MACWCPTKEGNLHLKWWISKRINQDRWVHCLCTAEGRGHINYETATESSFPPFPFFSYLCDAMEGTFCRQVVLFAKQDGSVQIGTFWFEWSVKYDCSDGEKEMHKTRFRFLVVTVKMKSVNCSKTILLLLLWQQAPIYILFRVCDRCIALNILNLGSERDFV